MLVVVLNSFYNFTGSYGVAIILLTLIIRALLHPLSHKQMVSMQKMQKLQPRIKTLQEKYKNDKETLNREIMSMYKENKVNPAAGCLPLLVQLPILILLFRVLLKLEYPGMSNMFLGIQLNATVLSTLAVALGQTVTDSVHVGFGSVISALSSNPAGLLNFGVYMPNLILLVVISALTWLQQKMSTTGGNPQMAMMSWFMPLFLTFICLSLQAGVLLYWGTSSLIGVAQQWWVMRKTKMEMAEKPQLYKDKPAGTQANKQK
jgi:YidC/Oxa1 family membrane protein insertase